MGGRSERIGREATVAIQPGEHAWVFEAGSGLRVVGAVTIAPRGGAELFVDPQGRAVRSVELGPAFR